MLKKVTGMFFLCMASGVFAQNVGINTTGATPSRNAILDLNTGNAYDMGLLIPHVTLGASLATFSPPIINAATTMDTGLMVYNMNGSQPIGYYYWSGSTWVNVSAANNAWLLTGNSGTTVGTNYIGTNDSVPFEIKVNGKQRMLFNINHSCISAGLGDLGNITTGHNNDAWGNYALVNNTTGDYNSAVGGRSLYSNISGWGNNAHGHEALFSNTTGHSNSAIGDSTLYKNTTGINNTAIGILASFSNMTGSSITAVGDYAGYSNLNSRITAIGDSALYNNTTGANEAVGFGALLNNTTGSHNTAIGTRALQANITASGSFAAGHYAGYNSNADYVVFIGDSAGYSNISGIRNTAVGYQSLGLTTTGNSNTALGYTSLYHNIAGGQNTAIGYQADYSGTGYFGTATGYNSMAATTSGFYNTADGWSALTSNQTGSSNTAIGSNAGYNNSADQGVFIGDSAFYGNTTGTGNTGVGYAVGASNATGIDNTATGYQALYTNNSGNWNTALGYEALYKDITGSYNTAIGYNALYTNTGINNTATGYNALSSNTIGSQNTATGVNALGFTTYGGGNTADGYRALVSNTTLSGNTAIGDSTIYTQVYGTTFNSGNVAVGNSALFANNPTSTSNGNQNTAVGEYAMRYNSTGNLNTAEGYSALYGTTTGNNNTALGYNSLSANTAGSYNTAIGSGANVSFNGFTNATAIGAGATATASNTMVFGNSAVTQHEFTGAFMPYYGAAYNAGAIGQALISQGAGVAPQWGSMGVGSGGTGSSTYNPNALIFEGPTSTSPLTSTTNMTWNSNHNTLVLGNGTFQSFSSANFFGSVNSYYQLLLQNTNNGGNASTDLIVNDDQDSTHYGDLGINSSTYSQGGYSVQSPGDVYFYSNKSNVDIGTVNAAANGVDSIKFTCGGLNKSNLTEVMSPAGITTQVHFAADSLVIPIHTGIYTPKYIGETWIYQHAGDTTQCFCINTSSGRKVDSVSLGSSIGWTSAITGYSGTPTQTCKYTITHKICQVDVNISGTSNATTTTFTLPFIPKNSDFLIFGQYTDNGANAYAGVISCTAGSNIASCANNSGVLTSWHASGVKALTGLRISYEVQ